MSSYKCHLFDVDGTLVDSYPVILAALEGSLIKHGVQGVSRTELKHQVKYSPLTVLKGYGINCLNAYWEVYEKEIFKAKLYFDDTKKILQNRQLCLLLRQFDLLTELDAVIGWNDCNIQKPNPQPIIMALERLQSSPNLSTYTGDTESDITAAMRAGVRPIHAAWGSDVFPVSGNVTRLKQLKDLIDL